MVEIFQLIMFGPKRTSDQTRIKLPRRSLPPSIDYLQFAYAQAFQYKEKEVEITWSDYSSTKLFTLVVKVEHEKDIPFWTVSEESAKGSQFLWSDETTDLQVVESKILVFDPVSRDLIDNAQRPAPAQQYSPYREIFSNTYNGVKAQQQNSIRDSLTRMRTISTSGSGTSAASHNNNQIVSSTSPVVKNEPSLFSSTQQPLQTNEIEPSNKEAISAQAPSIAISRIILDELNDLGGNRDITSVCASAENIVSGTLDQTRIENKHLIKIIGANHLTGKLELINQDSGLARIFFKQGNAYSASFVNLDEKLNQAGLTDGESELQGDQALMEAIIWRANNFKFFIDEQSLDKNVNSSLETLINQGSGIRDDLYHLEKAGLKDYSILVKRQDDLGENELRLLLSKHGDEDLGEDIELYKRLAKKFTAADIVKNRPISKAIWVPIVYRFFANGLIEIKPPLAVNESALDFMAEGKAAVQTFKTSFIREESGVLSYPAWLYFLQYEYLRFQSYDIPMSIIVFEMSKVSTNVLGGLDLINKEETQVALSRINAIKRPLDFLGHFEAINYALLLPHTNIHTTSQLAKRIVRALTVQPLSANLDPTLLKLSFGVGSIPQDCKDLEELVLMSKKAMQQSKNGDFLIVQAGGASGVN